ncbi:hemerythrin domain-containing protein [Azospirillum rugosum]|uniref:Hemerythrin HHE cation binding domain-containing protein n=1 Tax=Azospirillum rugosum TaxID=416170 RepID=A0ABS4SGA5_9PROT|nr:hemerythrin domain-containing protein [Azospirillum rugosum]MBP2291599.1 hypothetical protein [Azospirillum rugosum]MDQ0524589.1 hypothetical protein [Azospirillum rugosum]
MTIAQLIQAAPAKANELFAKLSDTTVRAVKTRERLLAELRDELHLQMELETKHLFPALRRHPKLKELVADATADNKTARALLAELERMPKDDEGFAGKLAELRRVFQQHIRDERKELLPAMRKLLSDDETRAIAERMDTGREEIEEARRKEAEKVKRPPQASPEPEHDPDATGLREASSAIAEMAGKAVENTSDTAETSVRAAAEAMARDVSEVTAAVVRPAGTRPMATPMVDGFETLASIPAAVVSAGNEAGRVWMSWAEATSRTWLDGARELAGAPSPMKATEIQRRLIHEAMRSWLDAGTQLMDIALHASRGVMAPAKRQMERQTERLKRDV